MAGRRLVAVTLVTLCVATALAQDPTKVEPSHYRKGFENERVEVVYVHYGPHEKSTIHDHPGGVVVNLSGGHLRFTDQGGTTTDVIAKAGEARWFPPHKHRVENLGDTAYNAVYIGVKSGERASAKDSKVDEQTAEMLAAAFVESAKNQPTY